MKAELSPTERLEIRLAMVEEGVRELRGRQLNMEEAWKEFVPAVTNRISKEVIIPSLVEGLMHAIRLPLSLENKEEDPLILKEFRKKGES